jgi:uncharacterized membrane protein (UPF0127 family)
LSEVGIRHQILRVGLVIALLSGGCDGARSGQETEALPDAWIGIGRQKLAVELALSPAEQQLGLAERDSLAWGRGMIFRYPKPAFPRFWMKGMRFDIDIVWIRGDRIVDISHRVPHVPGENGPTVTSRELTDLVLEVPAGYAQANGWRRGMRVELEVLQE